MNSAAPLTWTSAQARRGGRAVFLDRDGVLNRAVVRDHRPFPPSSVDEFVLLPGVVAACARLRSASFTLVVVTNQPDIGRGTQTEAGLELLHKMLRQQLDLDAIYVCPHDDADGCPCRKPKAGMITSAVEDLGLDLVGSWMVGDRWRDVEAGRLAGCRTVFIDYDYSERRPDNPSAVCANLTAAATIILDDSAH